MSDERKMAYTEVDSFDDVAITLKRKELRHEFETMQVRHITSHAYVQAMWLKTLDCKLAKKDVRIAELEKELKIVEEELGNLCAIDGHNDVRNGLVVGRIQHYRYRDVSPVVLINRLIELLKRLTPPAESKEAAERPKE